jgi:hypothetical protein
MKAARGTSWSRSRQRPRKSSLRERRCLANAIYFLARDRPYRGQIALAQVILNRVRSPRFPQTICGVVYEDQMSPNCPFHFPCDGKTDNPQNDAAWVLAQSLAKKVMAGELWLPEIGYAVAIETALNIGPVARPESMIAATWVTNDHVVDGCSLIKFVLNGQAPVQGRLVASDSTNDLAVVNFPLPGTKAVEG